MPADIHRYEVPFSAPATVPSDRFIRRLEELSLITEAATRVEAETAKEKSLEKAIFVQWLSSDDCLHMYRAKDTQALESGAFYRP